MILINKMISDKVSADYFYPSPTVPQTTTAVHLRSMRFVRICAGSCGFVPIECTTSAQRLFVHIHIVTIYRWFAASIFKY